MSNTYYYRYFKDYFFMNIGDGLHIVVVYMLYYLYMYILTTILTCSDISSHGYIHKGRRLLQFYNLAVQLRIYHLLVCIHFTHIFTVTRPHEG